jgi:flagellar biosynthesis/type III secretory pathway chaperone
MNQSETDLETVFEALLEQSTSFLAALDLEKKAIISRDADALLKLSEQKKSTAETIAALDKSLKQIILKISPEPFNHYISQQPKLSKKWSALTETMQQCMKLNKENEYFLSSSIQHVSQALNLIITAATGAACTTYNKTGHDNHLTNDSLLIKA